MSSLRALAVVAAALGCFGCGSDGGGGGGDDDGGSTGGLFTGPSGGSDNDSSGGPTGGGDSSAAALCVDTINGHRAGIGLGPLARWSDAEACSDGEAASDAQTGEAHGAFGQCQEHAQNECPGWLGPPAEMITGCLQMMWDEGPGEDFSLHGHYLNMSSTQFTQHYCVRAWPIEWIWSCRGGLA
jgi:hypothetical protein